MNGEAKKAAVLLLPLEDGSMGEGNGMVRRALRPMKTEYKC